MQEKTYMLEADKTSKEAREFRRIFFSLINSANSRTWVGWHPLLRDSIRDEHATGSG